MHLLPTGSRCRGDRSTDTSYQPQVPHEAGVKPDAEKRVVLEARVVHGQVGALEVLRYDATELREDHQLVLRRTDKTKTKARGKRGRQRGRAVNWSAREERRRVRRNSAEYRSTTTVVETCACVRQRKKSVRLQREVYGSSGLLTGFVLSKNWRQRSRSMFMDARNEYRKKLHDFLQERWTS